MLPRLVHSLVLITLLLFASEGIAQQPIKPSGETQKPSAEQKKKAFELLESLVTELSTLQSRQNRARIASNIADSIWEHDQEKARSLFTQVEEILRLELQVEESKDPREQHTFQVFYKLRLDTIERIAKHDPLLALSFSKATSTKNNNQSWEAVEEERRLTIALAQKVAAKNPKLALEMARQMMKESISMNVIAVLNSLSTTDKASAITLQTEIVARLKTEGFSDNWEALNVAGALAFLYQTQRVNDETARALLDVLMAQAGASGCVELKPDVEGNPGICPQIGMMVRLLQKLDPARSRLMAHWALGGDIPGTLDDHPEGFDAGYVPLHERSVEEVISAARGNPDATLFILQTAMVGAVQVGDFDFARRIANEYGGKREVQQLLQAEFDRLMVWSTMNEQMLAELERSLAELSLPLEKFQLLIFVANQMAMKGDRVNPLRLLGQASRIVDSMKPGKEQAQAQLDLAKLYCLEKSSRCFEVIEPLVSNFNDLVEAAVKLDGYDNSYLRDSEWTMTAEGGVGSILTQLALDAGYYAWNDFDRSVQLSNRFARREIRMMAQLKIAQGILNGPPKRPTYGSPLPTQPLDGITRIGN